MCHTKWYTRLLCFLLSFLYHKLLDFYSHSSGFRRKRDCPIASEAILQDMCKSNGTKPQQNTLVKTMSVVLGVHRQQQLTSSAVSVLLYVRYVFPFYTQMVVGLAVIRPVRTHVTAPMDTFVTKLRGNVLAVVMMETRKIIGGMVPGVALDVSLVSYRTEQESVWW